MKRLSTRWSEGRILFGMALNSLGLGFVFTARDLASGTIGGLTRSFTGLDQAALRANQSYQRNIAVMGAGVATLAMGAVTLTAAYAAGSRAGAFEQEVQRIGAIAQSSGEQIDGLREAAIQVGLSTRFSPDEAVQGFQALASSGFNAAQSLEMLNQTLGFAGAGNVSIEQSAQSIAAAINVFSLSGDDAQRVGDQFIRIGNATNLVGADMQIAMANVQRGVNLTGQTIEEILPIVGMIVDAGSDASSAGTAVSSALQFMANNADKVKQTLGVDVVETLADGTQHFRAFGDIALEAGAALDAIENPAQRAALANELFGKFGVSAVTAVYGRLTGRGISDANGNVMHTAEAMNYLRGEMINAEGAAEDFNARLMDTLAGQEQLLAASTNTLGLLLGQAFAPIFKPVVAVILEFTRGFADMIRDMPEPFKMMLGRLVVGLGVVLTVAGAFLTLGAAVAILGPFFAAAASAAAGMFVALLPFVALFGVLAGAAYMLKRAYDENIGGIGDTFRQLYADVALVFNAIGQIVSQGFLSGEVAEEFGLASAGVQGFIETFHSLYVRAQEFGAGIMAGIDTAVSQMGPTLDAAGAAFDRLMNAMGFAGDAIEGVASSPLEKFSAAGASLGVVLGDLFTWVLDLGRVFADIGTGAISGFQTAFEHTHRSMGPVSDMLGELWDKLVKLGESLGLVNNGTSSASSGWNTFGEVVGYVAGLMGSFVIGVLEMIVEVFSAIVSVVQFVVNVFIVLWETVKFVGELISTIFYGIRDAFMLVVDGLIAGLGRLAMTLPEAVRPDWMNGLIQEGGAATRRIERRGNESSDRLDNLGSSLGRTGSEIFGPSAAQEQNRAREADLQADALARAMSGTNQRRVESRTTVVQLDGREIARAMSEQEPIMSEENFTPYSGG